MRLIIPTALIRKSDRDNQKKSLLEGLCNPQFGFHVYVLRGFKTALLIVDEPLLSYTTLVSGVLLSPLVVCLNSPFFE